MSGLLMASLMQKMTGSQSDYQYDDYDYDYTYGSDYGYGSAYGYDYGYNNNDNSYNTDNGASSGYGYDYSYDYAANSAPSPMSSIIQQMIQQKLAAAHPPQVQVTMDPRTMIGSAESTDTSSSEAVAQDSTSPVEIAPSPKQSHTDKGMHPSDQVSYRNAP